MILVTVGDLITYLEEFDEELEIFIAEQPHYPIVHRVKGVISTARFRPDPDDELSDKDEPEKILILEGGWESYGSEAWWY
jgi:hypothetical protein